MKGGGVPRPPPSRARAASHRPPGPRAPLFPCNVIPGRCAASNPESRDSGFVLRTPRNDAQGETFPRFSPPFAFPLTALFLFGRGPYTPPRALLAQVLLGRVFAKT